MLLDVEETGEGALMSLVKKQSSALTGFYFSIESKSFPMRMLVEEVPAAKAVSCYNSLFDNLSESLISLQNMWAFDLGSRFCRWSRNILLCENGSFISFRQFINERILFVKEARFVNFGFSLRFLK